MDSDQTIPIGGSGSTLFALILKAVSNVRQLFAADDFSRRHFQMHFSWCFNRLRAKKGPAPPPLGNFADISYLEENFKPHLLRDVCTLCSGALVSDSLLHMLL